MAPRNPCSFLPRRLQVVVTLAIVLVLSIVYLGNSNADDYDHLVQKLPYGPKLEEGVHKAVAGSQHIVDHIPLLGTPAHTPPPEQANSSSGDTRWYSDWKWKNPFSSSVVYDEQRAVLPPLQERAPIYTYYDKRESDDKRKKAEQQLVQIWRKAWWAKGFRPVVLSRSDAMHNPLFRNVQGLQLEKSFEQEIMRWLAWSSMRGGILANYMALPMGPYDDPLLSFLRRGEYPKLTRYEGLENGLFVGTAEQIDAALKEALRSSAIKRVKFMDEALPDDIMTVDPKHDGIAFYSNTTITTKYELIAEKLNDPKTVGDGFAMLPVLINSHLHLTWQNIFSRGIAVVKPLPEHTSALVEPAIDIARNLSQCAVSPIPASCPPNRPRCKPCVSNNVPITASVYFRNDSDLFQVGTVPHPLTTQTLVKQNDDWNVSSIRRSTARDVWILAATKLVLGTGISSFARLPAMKDTVASELGSFRTLWLSAEDPPLKDNEHDRDELDWIFGFQLPREPLADGKSETPVPGPERRPPAPKPEYGDGPIPSEEDLRREATLLESCKLQLHSGEKAGGGSAAVNKRTIEAWNLADTEIWKFVRAWNARRHMERTTWQKEESSFQGQGVFDRWKDKIS
ncbi:hypothetical protein CB0940_01047 [Cercospora beticola]|uniref:Uncharacterized protein n=1 Tax=Cercospora beticola TaxID=122368 RepID=A0A2G5IC69_CERBT|nr:hypothetical protein CB0940_01047 [Cercospora beticola]PIB02385.1 hypothetical protein CB0940_01047 [Cercospora beticola]WPA96472.1 hypothetical protein RHO25_001079 [Cercospora beticola]